MVILREIEHKSAIAILELNYDMLVLMSWIKTNGSSIGRLLRV
jgi:hypothetical protein